MSGGLITRVFVLHVVSVHYSPKHVYSCVLDSDDRCLRVASCILTHHIDMHIAQLHIDTPSLQGI